MQELPTSGGESSSAQSRELEPGKTFTRFVVWSDANAAECEPEDREWVQECLQSLGFLSLDELNGCSPTKAADYCDSIELFLNTYDFGAQVSLVMPSSGGVPIHVLDEHIACLNLSERPRNCLASAGIETVGQLLRYSEQDLIQIRNMGRKSVAEVSSKLLKLRTTVEPELETREAWQFGAGLLLRVDELDLPTTLMHQLSGREIDEVVTLVAHHAPTLRRAAELTISEVQAIRTRLRAFDLDLGRPAPDWVVSHLSELRKAFGGIIRSELIEGLVTFNPLQMSVEGEIAQILVDDLDDRKSRIVRRFYGWDGGTGATLEETGAEFEISRERVRQIVDGAVRDPLPEEFEFLDRALKYVTWVAPAEAEFVEHELKEARLTEGSIRLESLEATAKLLAKPLDWRVGEWAGLRIVVTEESAGILRKFHSVLRRRVSHFGTTRLSWIVEEMTEVPTASWLDLACRTIEGIKWLGSEHDWIWIPTSRNSVVSRLAKILSTVPEVDFEMVRRGILRDRRMDTVELPPEVFRELCQFVPWCRFEGDQLFASGAVPGSDTDSSESILGRILSERGPVLHRREFWELAQGQGVEEVRFNQLLSGSNIIVRKGPGFYGLIGTPLNDEEVSALPEEETESADAVVVVPTDGSGAISELNPGLTEFPEQLYRFVRKRQQLMAEQGSWSLAEIGLTAPDRLAIVEWGRLGRVGELGVSSRQWRAVAMAFLAFSSEVTRTRGQEGELWPTIYEALNPSLRSRLFSQPGAPKAFLREATEDACRSLRIRHAFGREGEQAWMRTVFLQFGFSRSGWVRLPDWLDNTGFEIASISDLLQSRFESPSFGLLWTTLKRWRHGQISRETAKEKLAGNPWVTPEDLDGVISAAIEERGTQSDSPDDGFCADDPEALLGVPRLRCREDPWRFELPLANTRFLTQARYTLRVGTTKVFPLVRHDEGYSSESNIEIDLDALTNSVVQVDLRHKGTACWPEPLDIRLLPMDGGFAFYCLSNGIRASTEEVYRSPERAYLLLSSDSLTVSESGSQTHRFLSSKWMVQVFENGIPEGFRVFRGENIEWELTPQASDPTDLPVLPKMEVRCGDGRWGDQVRLVVKTIPDIVPQALILGGLRVPLRDAGQGRFEGSIELVPSLENGTPVQIESLWKGRLRWVPSKLHVDQLYGFAIATGAGWMTLSKNKDIDAAYLKQYQLKAALPDHVGDEKVSFDSWAWMDGSHFWGRPRRLPSVVGDGVHGLGEPLQMSWGPYNRAKPKDPVARSILDTGVIARVERLEEEWALVFRKPQELTNDHDVWLWAPGSARPQVISRDSWRQVDGECRIRFDGATPLGFAVSERGKRRGSRTGPGGFTAFAEHLSMIEDWSETAAWLRWWRAPLLHPDLFPAIQRQFEAKPADSLRAWIGEPELEGAKLLEHREDNAWCALTREFSWDWRPTRSVATQVFEQFEVFDIDSTGLGQFADQMLAVNPIMLVRLLLSLSGRSGRQLTIDSQPFERLRNRLLDISPFSAPGEVRKQRELLLKKTAEAMDVAQEFVSKSLPLAAILLARTEREGIEPRDNWNLQVAIANRHLVGKYLAVELLQKVIDGELR